MSERCWKCFRPQKTCYCGDITAIETGVKFVVLMHPHEAYKERTGTGRLTCLSLVDSEIVIDTTFDKNKRVQALLADPAWYPMMLYPGEEAHMAEYFQFQQVALGRQLMIFLIDATWVMARKMVRYSQCLQALPRLSFSRPYRSRFGFKTQPADFCLSTIESTYYLIRELECAGVCSPGPKLDQFLDVFDKMTAFQMQCQKHRGRSESTTS